MDASGELLPPAGLSSGAATAAPREPPRALALLPLAGPVALLVLVNVLFSGYTTLSAAAFTSGTSPVVFAFLRDVTACACFVPALFLFERRGARVPRPEHWGHVIALAALGVWGSQLMSALAISNLSPAIYGLMKPVVPAVTMALAVALGMQPCSVRARSSQLKTLGVLAAVGGAVTVVVASGEEHEAKNAALGALYMLVQISSSSSYPLLQKHMLSAHGYSPLMLAAWAYIIGTVMIASSVVVAATDADSWRISPAAVGGILYSGVLSSFFNYTMMAWVNSRLSPVIVMSFYPLQAILAPLLAVVFLGASVGTADIVGGFIIVCGLASCIAGQALERASPPSAVAASEAPELAGSSYSKLLADDGIEAGRERAVLPTA